MLCFVVKEFRGCGGILFYRKPLQKVSEIVKSRQKTKKIRKSSNGSLKKAQGGIFVDRCIALYLDSLGRWRKGERVPLTLKFALFHICSLLIIEKFSTVLC